MNLHASSVALEGQAVLLAGASGAGKSDVALRLIDSGATLISDDQTELAVKDGVLVASSPETLAGLIEVRHVGLLRMERAVFVPVSLYVELTPHEQMLERLPMLETIDLLGHSVRRLWLPGFAASTPAKIRAALKYPQADEPLFKPD